MTTEHYSVSVILPTFRRFVLVLDTLEDLLNQNYPDFEIIVVDQNANWPVELKSRLVAIQRCHCVRWITLNPGVVAARNEAVRISRGQILLFIDDDVLIKERDFIWRHVRNYVDDTIAAVAGREWEPNRLIEYTLQATASAGEIDARLSSFQLAAAKWNFAKPLAHVLTFGRDYEHRVEVCCFSTCNGSVRRGVFYSVGGFDENFRGSSYGDDYDLALRLNTKGHRIIFDPEARLVHLRAPAGGLRLSDKLNPFSETSKALCCWLFILRHATWDFLWILAYNHLLRKTILLRKNVVRPWRQLLVISGFLLGLMEALVRVSLGPTSRLDAKGRSSSNVSGIVGNREISGSSLA